MAGPESDRESHPSAMATAPRRPSRRSKLVLLAVVAIVLLMHGPALRMLPRILAVEPPLGGADSLLILDGDRRLESAVASYQSGKIRNILLIPERGQRAADLGIIPARVELTRASLAARGVPLEIVQILAGQATTRWEQGELLRDWLAEHPESRVLVLCDRLESGHCRWVFGQVLGPATGARLQYLALPDRLVDESSWWTSRYAVKRVFNAAVRSAFDRLQGQPSQAIACDWNPDDYERTLSGGQLP